MRMRTTCRHPISFEWRGMGQKAKDEEAIPLCEAHYLQSRNAMHLMGKHPRFARIRPPSSKHAAAQMIPGPDSTQLERSYFRHIRAFHSLRVRPRIHEARPMRLTRVMMDAA
jgi:hypothetical protein